ncbi:MAG: hypothetical protein V9E94_18885 [Microthrixaceae bacterium]
MVTLLLGVLLVVLSAAGFGFALVRSPTGSPACHAEHRWAPHRRAHR